MNNNIMNMDKERTEFIRSNKEIQKFINIMLIIEIVLLCVILPICCVIWTIKMGD